MFDFANPLNIDIKSLSGGLLVDEIGEGILHGVEAFSELSPHNLSHLLFPLLSLRKCVLNGSVDTLVTSHWLVGVGGSALGTVFLEVGVLSLHLLLGFLHFLEVALETLNCALNVSGYLGKLLNIECDGHNCL